MPKGHPISVYTDPRYKHQNQLHSAKSNQSIADLRNPFKKWKPTQHHRQTTKALKQVTAMHVQKQSGSPVQPIKKKRPISAFPTSAPLLDKERVLKQL